MNIRKPFLTITSIALTLFALGCNAPPPQQLPDIESTVRARVGQVKEALTPPTAVPLPTYTPYPTFTPQPTLNLQATVEAIVEERLALVEAVATPTPEPPDTPTPRPTQTASPTPTHPPTPKPTQTPKPTPTPPPTPQPSPTPSPAAALWVGDLLAEIKPNPLVTEAKYGNKWIVLSGHVRQIERSNVGSGYRVRIGDVGSYGTSKSLGSVYCHLNSSSRPVVTKLVSGDRITVRGLAKSFFVRRVYLDPCSIEGSTFTEHLVRASCLELAWISKPKETTIYLEIATSIENLCDVAIWFSLGGTANFVNGESWEFTVTDLTEDLFVLGPGDRLEKSKNLLKPAWVRDLNGQITTVNLRTSIASDTGIPEDKSVVFD